MCTWSEKANYNLDDCWLTVWNLDHYDLVIDVIKNIDIQQVRKLQKQRMLMYVSN